MVKVSRAHPAVLLIVGIVLGMTLGGSAGWTAGLFMNTESPPPAVSVPGILLRKMELTVSSLKDNGSKQKFACQEVSK